MQPFASRLGILLVMFPWLGACGGSTASSAGHDAGGGGDGMAGGDSAQGSDAADGGCQPVPIHCQQGDCIDDPPAVCQNGAWVCLPGPARCYDAGTTACGPMLICDNATDYCSEFSGGPPPPPDAGNGVHYSCTPYPAACSPNPSCACLSMGAGCQCMVVGNGFIVSCAAP